MHIARPTATPDALIARVGALIDAGRCGAAGPLLAAVRQVSEPSPELCLLAVRLAEGLGDDATARAELDRAIDLMPNHAALRKQRAVLCQRLGDADQAARDAAEAVVIAPGDPDAKALLGAAMLTLGRGAEAVACLSEAAQARPNDATLLEALAIATEANGDSATAFALLCAGLTAAGGPLNLRNAAILFCIRHGDFAQAVTLAEQGRAAGTVDACLFGLKGHAQSSLGLHDEAAESYAEAFKLGPDDPYVRHLVAASGLLPGATRAPPEYLRAVFDGYADRFDTHLISLGYQIPGAIRRIVMEFLTLTAGTYTGPILDLGCGTGLVGVALSDLPRGRMTGIDVSRHMLAAAARKGLYDRLIEADVLDWLQEDTTSWGAILAADVLCYFGDLAPLLKLMRQRLRQGGWFVFSVEEAPPDSTSPEPGWRLQRQGRYVHTMAYVVSAASAAGLSVRSISRQTLRHEGGTPVAGILAVLELTA